MELEDLTSNMRQRARRNLKLGYKVKFMVDDGVIFWDGTDSSPPAIGTEDKGEADTTIAISAENLEKLMAGQPRPDHWPT